MIAPPRYALKFLRWFCHEEHIEEIEGNLTEIFEHEYERSPRRARLRFIIGVLKHVRPEFIGSRKLKQRIQPFAMLDHQVKIAFRNFKRHKTSFIINLIGLWSGLTCLLLIGLWVNDELVVDKFHANDDRLFQVLERATGDGGIDVSESTPGLLADALSSEFAGVEASIGFSPEGQYTVSANEVRVSAKVAAAGKDFFNAFSFGLLQGNAAQVLSTKEGVVVSEDLARKLFSTTTNVLGKRIEFGEQKQSFVVTGVFQNVSKSSTLKFDLLYSWELWKATNPWIEGWGNTSPFTYVLLKPGVDAADFENQVADLAKKKEEGQTKTFFIQKFSSGYLYGKYTGGVQSGGRIEYVRLFSTVGVFVLIIACINFINLSTARASRRMKEVGIRKTAGAMRTSLAVQFIVESILVTSFAVICSVTTAYFLLPFFNVVVGKQLVLPFQTDFILSLVSITLLTGFLAGLYPALYLSSFKPSAILRGNSPNVFGEQWVRKGLVVFQFSISIILISSVLIVSRQIDFIQSRDRGYNTDNIIQFDCEPTKRLSSFLTEVRGLPGVEYASTSSNSMIGRNSWIGGLESNGKEYEIRVELVRGNYDLIEMMQIEIVEGRSFDRNFPADTVGVVFNEAAIDILGLEDPIGQIVNNHKIIGVAKNFNFESLHEPVHPIVFIYSSHNMNRVMVRLTEGREQETIDAIAGLYKQHNPENIFSYGFLSERNQQLHAAEQRVSALSKYFAATAIIISCLGLFGLAAFTAERRMKEIGIRKVLGSTSTNIVWLLTSGFARTVGLAIAIALPFSYFIGQQWLSTFVYHVDLQWWYFVIAGGMALTIAWFTVGMQTLRAARVNPTECLRSE